jgi:hypothetical protein
VVQPSYEYRSLYNFSLDVSKVSVIDFYDGGDLLVDEDSAYLTDVDGIYYLEDGINYGCCNTKNAKISMVRYADQTSIDTPAAGYKMLAFKSTGLFYVNESGTEFQFATLTGTETFTNKTLTTPTIGDFTNAAHDHEDAAGGATLDAAAIGAGTLDNARVNWAELVSLGAQPLLKLIAPAWSPRTILLQQMSR